jgi:parvulin-like peptidyl-prolyl isomerase
MRFLIAFAAVAASVCAQAPFATAPEDPNNPVVAIVAGQQIRVSDVKHMLEISPPEFTKLFKQAPQQAIQQYFMLKYLAAEGEKLKLAEQSPLKEQLETMRANVVAQAMVNHQRDGFDVPLEMIKNYYERNKSHYEQAKIKMIFLRIRAEVPTTGSLEDAARAALNQNTKAGRPEVEVKKTAEDIQTQLKAGAKFEAMVDKYSDDADSKARGGAFDKPITVQSGYPEDIKKAVFAMKPGDVSAPIRQPEGYYLIQVTEKTVQPMDEVIETMIQEIRQTHLQDYMNGLNSQFAPRVTKADFFVNPDEYLKK